FRAAADLGEVRFQRGDQTLDLAEVDFRCRCGSIRLAHGRLQLRAGCEPASIVNRESPYIVAPAQGLASNASIADRKRDCAWIPAGAGRRSPIRDASSSLPLRPSPPSTS